MTQQKLVSRLVCESGMVPVQLTTAASTPVALFALRSRAGSSSSKQETNGSDLGWEQQQHPMQILSIGVSSSSSRELVRRTMWVCAEEITCITADANASAFATGSRSGFIQMYDAKLRHPVYSWKVASDSVGTTSKIHALALSPDGNAIVGVCSSSPVSSSARVIEWACSEDTFASAAAADSPNSYDSSDDGVAETGLRQRSMPTPPILCCYALADEAGDGAEGDDNHEHGEREEGEDTIRYRLHFHPSGRKFLVAVHKGSTLISVQLFKVCISCSPSLIVLVLNAVCVLGRRTLTNYVFHALANVSTARRRAAAAARLATDTKRRTPPRRGRLLESLTGAILDALLHSTQR